MNFVFIYLEGKEADRRMKQKELLPPRVYWLGLVQEKAWSPEHQVGLLVSDKE